MTVRTRRTAGLVAIVTSAAMLAGVPSGVAASRPVVAADGGTLATRSAEAARTGRDRDGRPLTGVGVSVAVVDTGVDVTHPAFRLPDGTSKVVRDLTTVCTGRDGCIRDVAPGVGSDTPLLGGHGTHVAGVVAGDRYRLADGTVVGGSAPDARIVAISTSLLLVGVDTALHWILAHHRAPCGPTVPTTRCPPIRVVNLSFGAPDGSPVIALQRALVRAGIVVVWAAGNGGGNGSRATTNPAGRDPTPGVLSVASYDDLGTGTRDGRIAAGSSRGGRDAPATWPDLAAPGVAVVSACRPLLLLCSRSARPADGPGPADVGTYNTMTGTSDAAPQVAGIVAQLLQACPNATPADVETALVATAHRFRDGAPYVAVGGRVTSYDKGAGLVDTVAAVDALTHRPACSSRSVTTSKPA